MDIIPSATEEYKNVNRVIDTYISAEQIELENKRVEKVNTIITNSINGRTRIVVGIFTDGNNGNTLINILCNKNNIINVNKYLVKGTNLVDDILIEYMYTDNIYISGIYDVIIYITNDILYSNGTILEDNLFNSTVPKIVFINDTNIILTKRIDTIHNSIHSVLSRIIKQNNYSNKPSKENNNHITNKRKCIDYTFNNHYIHLITGSTKYKYIIDHKSINNHITNTSTTKQVNRILNLIEYQITNKKSIKPLSDKDNLINIYNIDYINRLIINIYTNNTNSTVNTVTRDITDSTSNLPKLRNNIIDQIIREIDSYKSLIEDNKITNTEVHTLNSTITSGIQLKYKIQQRLRISNLRLVYVDIPNVNIAIAEEILLLSMEYINISITLIENNIEIDIDQLNRKIDNEYTNKITIRVSTNSILELEEYMFDIKDLIRRNRIETSRIEYYHDIILQESIRLRCITGNTYLVIEIHNRNSKKIYDVNSILDQYNCISIRNRYNNSIYIPYSIKIDKDTLGLFIKDITYILTNSYSIPLSQTVVLVEECDRIEDRVEIDNIHSINRSIVLLRRKRYKKVFNSALIEIVLKRKNIVVYNRKTPSESVSESMFMNRLNAYGIQVLFWSGSSVCVYLRVIAQSTEHIRLISMLNTRYSIQQWNVQPANQVNR
ncbi:hypothetical protein NEOKW01_0224 [Nematocida sp. AWRm80]|nr:hypothetical protein NEOKW01_0224 [Nematocida sp. AWRm80]